MTQLCNYEFDITYSYTVFTSGAPAGQYGLRVSVTVTNNGGYPGGRGVVDAAGRWDDSLDRRNIARMSKLIRMDHTGHSTLAEWTEDNPEACQAAIREFRRQLDEGCIGMVSDGPGKATQVRELPLDADLVILRRPIAGG